MHKIDQSSNCILDLFFELKLINQLSVFAALPLPSAVRLCLTGTTLLLMRLRLGLGTEA